MWGTTLVTRHFFYGQSCTLASRREDLLRASFDSISYVRVQRVFSVVLRRALSSLALLRGVLLRAATYTPGVLVDVIKTSSPSYRY